MARATAGVPGALSLLALGTGLWALRHAPQWLHTSTTLVSGWLAWRTGWLAYAAWRAWPQVAHWQAFAWGNPVPASFLLWETASVQHVVIIPNAHEPETLLDATLTALGRVRGAAHLHVILAVEDADADAGAKAARLQQRHAKRFAGLHITLHPAGLPGEVPCKSANLGWAVAWVNRVLVPQQRWQHDRVLLTLMDADVHWDAATFEAVGALFAADPHRLERFWQGVLTYHGNVWHAQPIMRLIHAAPNAFELGTAGAGPSRGLPHMPMSSYSVSLALVNQAGGFDGDVIADEWHMFVKAYFATQGRARVTPVLLPFHATMVDGPSIPAALLARYRQAVRHAWGTAEMGHVLAQWARHPNTPGAALLLARASVEPLLAGPGTVMLLLGGLLPWLWPPARRGVRAWLGWVFSVVSLGATLFGLWQDARRRPPRPQPATWRTRLREWAGLPLLPLAVLTSLTLPVQEAQLRLLLGRRLHFRVTPKSTPGATTPPDSGILNAWPAADV